MYYLRQSDGALFQGIPRDNGPLGFDTEQEAQARCDEINSWGLYDFTLSVEEITP